MLRRGQRTPFAESEEKNQVELTDLNEVNLRDHVQVIIDAHEKLYMEAVTGWETCNSLRELSEKVARGNEYLLLATRRRLADGEATSEPISHKQECVLAMLSENGD